MACLRAFLLVLTLLGAGVAQAVVAVVPGAAKDMKGSGSLSVRMDAASYAAGDLLVAQIVSKQAASITPPAGWSAVPNAGQAGSGVQQRIYMWRVPTGTSLPDLHAFSISGLASDQSSSGVIYVLRGVHVGKPICGTPAGRYGGGSTVTAEQIQPPQPGDSVTGQMTCPTGSILLAFFGSSSHDANLQLALENGATRGVENRAGDADKGVGMFGSYLILSADGLGGGQSGNVSNPNGMNFATATIVFNADPNYVPPASFDHIRLAIDGTPLTCTPATVKVSACSNAACSSTASSAVSVNLGANNGGVWGTSNLAFTGTANTTLAVRNTNATTLSATGTPAASNPTRCFVNGSEVSCAGVRFADSGLLLGLPAPHVAGQGSTFTLAAVKKDDTSVRCVPAFASVTRSVALAYVYANPASGTLAPAINGGSLGSPASPRSFSLVFDAQGVARNIPLSYLDAGQLSLSATYTGSSGNGDAGLTMTGSGTFTSIPYALCVTSSTANWNCAAGDTSCAKFVAAGSPFNLSVTGKAYSSASADACALPTTPNYAQSGIILGATLVAPAGGVNGALAPTALDVTGGSASNASQTQSEVGVFTITATPPANAYFSYTVPAGSARSGRFVPAGFALAAVTLNDRADINTATTPGAAEIYPSSFTYLDEPARALFRLEARNVAGVVTQNYRGSFARLDLASNQVGVVTPANALVFGAQHGTPSQALNTRLKAACAAGSCGSFSAGAAELARDLTLTRGANGLIDGPFDARFGVRAIDPDGVGMLAPVFAIDPGVAANAALLGQTRFRFGRMRLEAAYGTGASVLPVAAYAQYWSGTVFLKNTDDSATPLVVPASSSITASQAAALYCTGGLGLYAPLAGVGATLGGLAAGQTARLASGDAALVLSRRGAGTRGYLDLALAVPDYLKFNWDGVDQTPVSCASSPAVADGILHDDNPRTRIRFGIRRDDAIIYLREVY